MGSRAVILGERMNLRPTTAKMRRLLEMNDRQWASAARLLGAFRDPRSRRTLLRVGLDACDCRCINLLPPSPQEVPWDAPRARRVAKLICRGVASDPPPVVYAVGGRVATAILLQFGRRALREVYGTRLTSPLLPGVPVVPVPHPSGLNLWWNDAAAVEALRARLCEGVTCAQGE